MVKQSLSGWNGRFQSPEYWLCIGFGSGLLRPAPGTWGSLAGLAIGYALILSAGLWGILTAALIVTVLSVAAINRIEKKTGVHDAPEIVIDEFVGQWISMLPLLFTGPSFLGLFLAFGLFRIFDIVKPWPIGPLDRKVSGGFGVMVDDIVAGVFAAICLQMILVFLL